MCDSSKFYFAEMSQFLTPHFHFILYYYSYFPKISYAENDVTCTSHAEYLLCILKGQLIKSFAINYAKDGHSRYSYH